jgi:hypothetical protein
VKLAPVSQSPPKYKDYLTKMRVERQHIEKDDNPELRELKEFKKIMKKDGSISEKVYNAKMIASRLEGKAKNDPKLMAASISAKIEIISQLIDF